MRGERPRLSKWERPPPHHAPRLDEHCLCPTGLSKAPEIRPSSCRDDANSENQNCTGSAPKKRSRRISAWYLSPLIRSGCCLCGGSCGFAEFSVTLSPSTSPPSIRRFRRRNVLLTVIPSGDAAKQRTNEPPEPHRGLAPVRLHHKSLRRMERGKAEGDSGRDLWRGRIPEPHA